MSGSAYCRRQLALALTIGFASRPILERLSQHAVWLYLRFALSFRDVEDLLAKRLRATRPAPTERWHLDEVFVSIACRQTYLWRGRGPAPAAKRAVTSSRSWPATVAPSYVPIKVMPIVTTDMVA